MHILVATPDRVEHLVETHELTTLFADEGYRAAFAARRLTVEVHPARTPTATARGPPAAVTGAARASWAGATAPISDRERTCTATSRS